MTASIKEDVASGYKRYVHPDALPSPVNSMTATTTTPLVITGVVVTCAQPSVMNGANTSPANQPNSNPSKQRVCRIRSRGWWMVLVCGCSLSWRLHYSLYYGGFRDFNRGLLELWPLWARRGCGGHRGGNRSHASRGNEPNWWAMSTNFSGPMPASDCQRGRLEAGIDVRTTFVVRVGQEWHMYGSLKKCEVS
jgi:hypothetical protein